MKDYKIDIDIDLSSGTKVLLLHDGLNKKIC